MALRTVLVVPCFNEEQRLASDVFHAFAQGKDWLTILLVDDGSRDGTRGVLQALADRDPAHFKVLGLDVNGGKAEAVRQGVLRALEMSPECVGFWDADLATPLEALPEFVATLEEHPSVEMALGSRVQLLGRNIDRDRGRHYFGRVAATAVSAMLGLRVYDTQCGAKLFRATPSTAVLFQDRFLTRWVFDVEILARWIKAQPAGFDRRTLEARVVEIPLKQWTDVKGSRLKPTDFLKAPMELARIWNHYFGPGVPL
jgi:dolichyl-phosphate beta-glucosyltransferase